MRSEIEITNTEGLPGADITLTGYDLLVIHLGLEVEALSVDGGQRAEVELKSRSFIRWGAVLFISKPRLQLHFFSAFRQY